MDRRLAQSQEQLVVWVRITERRREDFVRVHNPQLLQEARDLTDDLLEQLGDLLVGGCSELAPLGAVLPLDVDAVEADGMEVDVQV